MFQEAIQPTIRIQPTKGALHFPTLMTKATLRNIFRRSPPRLRDMIPAIGADRDDAPLSQGASMRFAVIAFIESQAFRLAFAAPDANAVNGFE
jgi:hypothetical protein